MANLKPVPMAREFDLAHDSLRELNLFLHKRAAEEGVAQIHVRNPDGAHSIAVGLDAAAEAVLAGLETPGLWDSIEPELTPEPKFELRASAEPALHPMAAASAHVPVSRWLDGPVEAAAVAEQIPPQLAAAAPPTPAARRRPTSRQPSSGSSF